MKSIFIIGATSHIAQETARLMASGNSFYLLARNDIRLQAFVSELKERGARVVHTAAFEAEDLAAVADQVKRGIECLGHVDVGLIAHGELPDQETALEDDIRMVKNWSVNSTSALVALSLLRKTLMIQRSGHIVVLSSVAGERGRKSNYLYGAAKASLSAFCEGLAAELAPFGVGVLTVKLGPVDTPMTQHLRRGLLMADVGGVAVGIMRAMERKKRTIYLPRYWGPIMSVLRWIPAPIFSRLPL